jgi:hypothetical protein
MDKWRLSKTNLYSATFQSGLQYKEMEHAFIILVWLFVRFILSACMVGGRGKVHEKGYNLGRVIMVEHNVFMSYSIINVIEP